MHVWDPLQYPKCSQAHTPPKTGLPQPLWKFVRRHEASAVPSACYTKEDVWSPGGCGARRELLNSLGIQIAPWTTYNYKVLGPIILCIWFCLLQFPTIQAMLFPNQYFAYYSPLFSWHSLYKTSSWKLRDGCFVVGLITDSFQSRFSS